MLQGKGNKAQGTSCKVKGGKVSSSFFMASCDLYLATLQWASCHLCLVHWPLLSHFVPNLPLAILLTGLPLQTICKKNGRQRRERKYKRNR